VDQMLFAMARVGEWEREAAKARLVGTVREDERAARRPDPMAKLDRLVLRASRGAAMREARREIERTVERAA
jgi:hypothetical protein